MPYVEMNSGSGGGGSYSPVVAIDTNNLLGSISSRGGSYTATEDCGMYGSIYTTSGSNTTLRGTVYCNGKTLFDFKINSNATPINNSFTIGNSANGMFIPKGSTISLSFTSGNVGTINIGFYKLA